MNKITSLYLILCLCMCACAHTRSPQENPEQIFQGSPAVPTSTTIASQTSQEPAPVNAKSTAYEVIRKDNLSHLQSLRRLGEGTFGLEFDLSADGKILALTNSAGILLIDSGSGKRLRLIPTPAGTESVAFSPDGKILAAVYRLPKAHSESSANSGLPETSTNLGVWRVEDGSVIFQKDLSGSNCGEHYARQLSFSQDNQQISFIESISERGRGEWRNLCVYSSRDGQLLQAHDLLQVISGSRFQEAVYSKALDKTAIATGEDIVILNASFQLEARITTDMHPNVMAFSPDGKRLAFAGYDKNGIEPQTKLRILNLDNPHSQQILQEMKVMFISLAWSPDGQWIAGGMADGVVVWNVSGEIAFQQEPIILKDDLSQEIPGSIWDFAFSPSADILYGLVNSSTAYVPSQLRTWHIPDGKQLFQLSDKVGTRPAFSPDGRRLACGGFADGRLQIWDTSSDELALEWESRQGLVRQVLYTPDGTSILSAGQDGSLGVWDAQNGHQQEIWKDHNSDVLLVGINSQGNLLTSASRDGKIIVREFPSGNIVKTLDAPQAWIPSVLAFTADGNSLLMGWNLYNSISGYRGQWSIWNGQTDEVKALANTWPVEAFTDAHGKTYAVWSDTAQVLFGELDGDRLTAEISLRSPKGTGSLNGYTISPDGSLLVSGNAFGLHVWTLPDTEPNILEQSTTGGYPYGQMAFSTDGTMLAISNPSAPLTIWGIAP